MFLRIKPARVTVLMPAWEGLKLMMGRPTMFVRMMPAWVSILRPAWEGRGASTRRLAL